MKTGRHGAIGKGARTQSWEAGGCLWGRGGAGGGEGGRGALRGSGLKERESSLPSVGCQVRVLV